MMTDDARIVVVGYRVRWMVRATGYEGHGSLISQDAADHVARWSNTKHPDIHHWVETVYELEADSGTTPDATIPRNGSQPSNGSNRAKQRQRTQKRESNPHP